MVSCKRSREDMHEYNLPMADLIQLLKKDRDEKTKKRWLAFDNEYNEYKQGNHPWHNKQTLLNTLMDIVGKGKVLDTIKSAIQRKEYNLYMLEKILDREVLNEDDLGAYINKQIKYEFPTVDYSNEESMNNIQCRVKQLRKEYKSELRISFEECNAAFDNFLKLAKKSKLCE